MGVTNKQRGSQRFVEGFELSCRAYAADGALQAQLAHHCALSKVGVGAYTLAAPMRQGIGLTLISRTAFAHVVTAPGLIDDGATGGSKTTLTFPAFVGASISLLSFGGKWNVVRRNVVAIT